MNKEEGVETYFELEGAALWRAQVHTTLRGAVVGNVTEDRINRGKVLGSVQFSSVQSLSRV